MANDLVVKSTLTASDIRTQVNLIAEVMQAVMKPEIHYGIVPGTKKPSLFKAGAEKLCAVFRVAEEYRVEDLSSLECIRYRVHCIGTHQSTGIVLGSGVGECSSDEEKYKWRSAVCAEEWEETPPNKRRVKYGKSYGKIEKRQQVKTDPADVGNTVLKMACKRAKIAMTLNVTAASDFFTQDIEDLPEHLRQEEAGDAATPTSAVPLKPYSEASFEVNLPKWSELITAGKRTADEIIAMVNSKATLTDDQKNRIRGANTPLPNNPPCDVPWEPTQEELAAIRSQELLEMGGQA